MNILIMRHGEAQAFAESDSQRQLTPNGQSQAIRAGQCLNPLLLSFNEVWVSPYIRAQQTANAVLEAAGLMAIPRRTVASITPDNSVYEVANLLEKSNVGNLLLVSHQPLVSTLVGLLVHANTNAGPPMAPASMVLLETDCLMSGNCNIRWLRHAPNFEVSNDV